MLTSIKINIHQNVYKKSFHLYTKTHTKSKIKPICCDEQNTPIKKHAWICVSKLYFKAKLIESWNNRRQGVDEITLVQNILNRLKPLLVNEKGIINRFHYFQINVNNSRLHRKPSFT